MKILRNTIEVDDRKISHFNYNECETFFPHYANNELIQFRNVFPTFIVSQYDYIYDAAGRRSERYHSGSAFATPDQIYYDYNSRSELTNAVASIDASYSFSYSYDDIGNRLWSIEDTNHVEYAANNLNQYTAVDAFTPQYDADGNQTLIKTSTGIWSATYNGENRPIYWSNGITNIVMSFDRMGRRVQYLEATAFTTNANNTFTYDNYLCVARNRNQVDGTTETDYFIWDPTEPIATRPLVFNYSTTLPSYYTHDGHKNVSELIDEDEGICAHYEYIVYGAIKLMAGFMANVNPLGFSSEFYDASLDLVYYNYRNYNLQDGRWICREPLIDVSFQSSRSIYAINNNSLDYSLYNFVGNAVTSKIDIGGLFPSGENDCWGEGCESMGNCWRYACNDKRNITNETARVNPPGIRFDENGYIISSCEELMNAIERTYGVKRVDDSDKCEKCNYKVYLALEEHGQNMTFKNNKWHVVNLYSDYHWYRQDTDSNCRPTGKWSHKPGLNKVETDVSNPAIDAKSRKYNISCGYLCFPCTGLDADKR